MRLQALIAGAMILSFSALGCEPNQRETAKMIDPVDDLRWPYWPRQMAIHRLSRIVVNPESPELTLEARIEFRDPDGHTTRAVGELVLELHDPASPGADSLILTWNISLREQAENRRRFDHVTRTYLFPLKTEGKTLPELVELRAAFTADDGWVPPDAQLRRRTSPSAAARAAQPSP